MACNVTPNGDCTWPPDDTGYGKIFNEALGTIEPSLITSDGLSFTFYWNVDPLLTDQLVAIQGRKRYIAAMISRASELHTVGELHTEVALTAGSEYKWWMRRETDIEYGPWSSGLAYSGDGWTSAYVVVYHGIQVVMHGEKDVVFA